MLPETRAGSKFPVRLWTREHDMSVIWGPVPSGCRRASRLLPLQPSPRSTPPPSLNAHPSEQSRRNHRWLSAFEVMSLNTVSVLWQRTKKALFIATGLAACLLSLCVAHSLSSTREMLSCWWVTATSPLLAQIILVSHNLFISCGSAWFHRLLLKAVGNYFYIFPFTTYC